MSALVCPSCRGVESTLVSIDAGGELRRCENPVCGRLFRLDAPPRVSSSYERVEADLMARVAAGEVPTAFLLGMVNSAAETAVGQLDRAGLARESDRLADVLALVERVWVRATSRFEVAS